MYSFVILVNPTNLPRDLDSMLMSIWSKGMAEIRSMRNHEYRYFLAIIYE